MDIENLKEILYSTIDNKHSLSPSIQLIEEIQSSTWNIQKYSKKKINNILLICIASKENTAYSHLILREKYFILIQNIIETRNELIVKFVFQLLQVIHFWERNSFDSICKFKLNF